MTKIQLSYFPQNLLSLLSLQNNENLSIYQGFQCIKLKDCFCYCITKTNLHCIRVSLFIIKTSKNLRTPGFCNQKLRTCMSTLLDK